MTLKYEFIIRKFLIPFVLSFFWTFCYFENRFVTCNASKTRCQVFSAINVCYLKNESWVSHFLGFKRILFFFLTVPEPFV